MDGASGKEGAAPIMCKCGFFGSPDFNNMCSRCFKEAQGGDGKRPTPAPAASTAKTSPAPAPARPAAAAAAPVLSASSVMSNDSAADAGAAEADDTVDDDLPRKIQKKKNKCWACKCKISLVQQSTNECRCGYTFCDKHRYAEDHDCDFDHITQGRSVIQKQLPSMGRSVGRGVHRLDSQEEHH